MNRAQKHLETIHGFPEHIRRVLAGTGILIVAVVLFYSWESSVSNRLTDLSQDSKVSEQAVKDDPRDKVVVLDNRSEVGAGLAANTALARKQSDHESAAAFRAPGMFDWIFSAIEAVVGRVNDLLAQGYMLISRGTSRVSVGASGGGVAAPVTGQVYSFFQTGAQRTVQGAGSAIAVLSQIVTNAMKSFHDAVTF